MHAQLCRLPIPGSWADVRRLHYHCRKAAGRLDEVRRALMAHENEDAMQAMLLLVDLAFPFSDRSVSDGILDLPENRPTPACHGSFIVKGKKKGASLLEHEASLAPCGRVIPLVLHT